MSSLHPAAVLYKQLRTWVPQTNVLFCASVVTREFAWLRASISRAASASEPNADTEESTTRTGNFRWRIPRDRGMAGEAETPVNCKHH